VVSERLVALTTILQQAWADALHQLDPAALVAAALPPRPPRGARVRVIAAGKAATRMARGAFDRWDTRIEDALVVTVDGATMAIESRIDLRHAAHPVPDQRSVDAADEALRRAQPLGARDLLLALISGGASALLCAPAAGLDLEAKRAVSRCLLEAGAPIAEVNLVRRHLSRVKGGRLAAAAHPARVLTLVIGDVVGGTAADVGSGPTVPSEPDRDAARAVLERWAPRRAAELSHHLCAEPLPALRARTRMLAGPQDLARAMGRCLQRAGMRVRVPEPDAEDVAVTVERRLVLAASLAPGEAAVIACEPTVALPPSAGRGGRAGRCALLAVGQLPPDVVLLCAASDGADGSSGHGGAMVTGAQVRSATVDEALRSFDDAGAHASMGTALPGGPTGNNLADVHVVARAR
jgi:hydroxypyruvate reductase